MGRFITGLRHPTSLIIGTSWGLCAGLVTVPEGSSDFALGCIIAAALVGAACGSIVELPSEPALDET